MYFFFFVGVGVMSWAGSVAFFNTFMEGSPITANKITIELIIYYNYK